MYNLAGESNAYLGGVGTEEFLQKLTTQITEMVSARITQGKWEVISELLEWFTSVDAFLKSELIQIFYS